MQSEQVRSSFGFLYKIPSLVRDACTNAGRLFQSRIFLPVVKSTVGIAQKLLHQYYDGKEVCDSDVVVVFTARHDTNGALFHPQVTANLKLHRKKDVKIIYKYVSSIHEINTTVKEIKSRNNRITSLMIRAHGSPSGFRLGDVKKGMDQQVTNSNSSIATVGFLKETLDSLEKDATVILDSCSTARVKSDGLPSIAQSIASLAPHTRVYAPIHNTNGIGFDVQWEQKRVVANFTVAKRSDQSGFFAKIQNCLYKAGFYLSLGYFATQTDTAILKHYSAPTSIKG